MKTSFLALSSLFFIGNLWLLLDSTIFPGLLNPIEIIGDAFSLVLSSSIIVFGLLFPSFFRNLTFLTVATATLLGLLFMTTVLQLSIMPHADSIGQDRFRWIATALEFLALGFFCFIVTYKLEYSFPSLDSFIKSCYIAFSISFLIVALTLYFFGRVSVFSENHLGVLYFYDWAFLLCFIAFLIHFTFSEYYLDYPFLFLIQNPKKVFEDRCIATLEGTKGLKARLWELYETKNWKEFMDSFWFQILVDETLDNALEHGGKRGSDTITVHLYESQKFIEVYVTDKGKGFNPKLVPNPLNADRKMVPSGRGIHILKKLFSVRWNFLGNEVCIRIDKSKIVEMHSIP